VTTRQAVEHAETEVGAIEERALEQLGGEVGTADDDGRADGEPRLATQQCDGTTGDRDDDDRTDRDIAEATQQGELGVATGDDGAHGLVVPALSPR
jgi:hypothetical protein